MKCRCQRLRLGVVQPLGDLGTHVGGQIVQHDVRRLPRAVADARDQECSWAQIGDLLGVTRASAWQRYGGHTARDRTPLEPD